jgi:hypothetical protein
LSLDDVIIYSLSGLDECVPPHVDKGALLRAWYKCTEDEGSLIAIGQSGVVEGATHNYESSKQAVPELADRVREFLQCFE